MSGKITWSGSGMIICGRLGINNLQQARHDYLQQIWRYHLQQVRDDHLQ
jgi:hypothetical protein